MRDYLRRYLGYNPYSEVLRRASHARGWVPGAGPATPLVMDCITAEWVQAVVENPGDKQAHAKALVSVARTLPPMP